MKIPFMFMFSLLFFTETFATIWTVDDDGTAQFTKIQDAVDVSSDGDTIFVFNGFYEECLAIPKNIFLIGENNQQIGSLLNSDLLIYNNYIINNHEGIFFDIENPGINDSVKIIANSITDNDYGIVYFPEQILSGPPFDTT